MTMEIEIRDKPLPSGLQALLADYPRETWFDHPNFKPSTANWLGAHQMFRQLAELMIRETEDYLNGELDSETFAVDLGFYGNALVQNLHGHHHWEDRSYFPELAQAHPQLQAGLDILEHDHIALNALLDRFTRVSNRVIKLVQLDESQARAEAKSLLPLCRDLSRLLTRHLEDEENLAVPIILHHKLRG